ncbi:MAG: ribosome maturation factor RimM, partial [Lachnospiraceae bacterium]|nr:ribosome maturation factor RimM [Lachnospiraceae bacterium]
LFVTRENAVKLKKGEYFIADLIGVNVVSEDGALKGILKDVMQTGANDVYVIELSDGRELLLPAIKECVLAVDLDENTMKIHVLDGLLDK